MKIDDVCAPEQLSFLNYLNERVLLYCITLLAFSGVFCLIWVVKKYTYFEKLKLPMGNTPKFPYGNFKQVVNRDSGLYQLLWKYYNRFKRKQCRLGGIFVFTKPLVVVVDRDIINEVCDNNVFEEIFPKRNKVDHQKLSALCESTISKGFLKDYNQSLKGTLQETLKKDDVYSVLKNYLLESISIYFGLKSVEIIEEINILLKNQTEVSFRHYLSLCYSCFKKKTLVNEFEDIFLEIMNDRKKNDLRKDDVVQYFIDIYNESNCDLQTLACDMFDLFASTLIHSYSASVFCLYEMVNNLDIQEEVIGEIRRFNKRASVVTLEDLQELQYLDAVVKETLRKYPPIPSVLKLCVQDFNKGEVVLPKGLLVAISVLGIHRDPDNFTNPDKFDPDRFIEQSYLNLNNFIPFGVRNNSPIEMQLTIFHTKLVLINIFSRCKIRLKKEDASSVLRFNPNLIPLRPCETFEFLFETL